MRTPAVAAPAGACGTVIFTATGTCQNRRPTARNPPPPRSGPGTTAPRRGPAGWRGPPLLPSAPTGTDTRNTWLQLLYMYSSMHPGSDPARADLALACGHENDCIHGLKIAVEIHGTCSHYHAFDEHALDREERMEWSMHVYGKMRVAALMRVNRSTRKRQSTFLETCKWRRSSNDVKLVYQWDKMTMQSTFIFRSE